MKKFTLVIICFFSVAALFSQNHHAIKAGINFARVGGDIPDYSEISAKVCPTFSWVFRTMGDRWGYFLELGYSQSGFKEKYEHSYLNEYGAYMYDYEENTLTVHNIDLIPAGLQYAFLSDWSKVRPILQTSIMLRFSMTYTLKTLDGSTSEMPKNPFDLMWSAGGGIMLTRHATFTVNYGLGLLNILNSGSGLKNRQLQVSGCYFF